jgi:hypothetical protein
MAWAKQRPLAHWPGRAAERKGDFLGAFAAVRLRKPLAGFLLLEALAEKLQKP